MKKLLQTTVAIGLLSVATFTNAAPSSGEWVAKLWNDSTGAYADTWSICIQNGADWYVSSSLYTGIKGKLFSKGNDSHLQAIHSSGTAAVSFDVSRINNKLLLATTKLWTVQELRVITRQSLLIKGKFVPLTFPKLAFFFI